MADTDSNAPAKVQLGTPPPPEQKDCRELVPRSPDSDAEKAAEDFRVHVQSEQGFSEDVEEEEETESGTSIPQSHTGSILIDAAQKGDIGAVRQVLDDRSVDPNKKTRYQARSALHLACGYGQLSVVEELLLAGAHPSQLSHAGRTPLHEACQGGHTDVLELLLDHTAELDIPDSDGQTAAHIAAYNGEVKCLEILYDRGAKLELEDRQGRTPAHMAAIRNHRQVVEFLYDSGVNLESTDDSGKRPVHYAAKFGALDCLFCLTERDCDITLGDNTGNLPIHHAASRNNVDCIRFLVRQGTPQESTQKDGKTAVHLAASSGSVKALHWLLDKGLAVDTIDKNGNSPIHCAIRAGYGECVNCLLQHGADLQIQNDKLETPLDTARRHGHPLLMEKAMKNEVTCPQCVATYNYVSWKRATRPPPVVQGVNRLGSKAYTSPVPKTKPPQSQLQKNANKPKYRNQVKKEPPNNLPKRDLAAKYFGEHLEKDLASLLKF